MLPQYIAKCKYIMKMIQTIAKLDEIFIHILNMNWLYHFNYNWKVWLECDSQKTYGQVFHSNEHKCVEKKHFVEKWISFKTWQELCWRSLYQNPFYMFIKMLNEIK
jgi:hypothetical protein